MFPTFHMNNFKPWTAPHTKASSPHISLSSRTAIANNPPPSTPCHDSHSPSTLSFPKHHLPARPPAEACVHISTNTRPRTPLESRSQPQEISMPPPPITPYSENLKHGITLPYDPAHRISDSDPIPPCDFRNPADVPIEPSLFLGDTAGRDPSSPSISRPDDSSEEFSRLPDSQQSMPIDPVILDDDEPWKASDLHRPAQQGDSLIIPGTICPYFEPPPILCNAPEHHRNSSEDSGSWNGNTQTTDFPHIQGHRQLHPAPHRNTETNASCSNVLSENSHGDERPENSKRRLQQSEGRATKRLQVPSTLPTREDSFITLDSHFLSVPLDERLQFLSWLFERALARCMPSTGVTTCGDGYVRPSSHSTPLCEIEQSQRDRSEAQGSSRKRKPWSTEEMDLLLKLRRDERRPWSEVTRLFSNQYPGRSAGSIKVYWSTTLKNWAD